MEASVARSRVYRRRSEDRLLTGTASGIAAGVGIDPLAVRCAFIVLTAFEGAGIALYAGSYLVMPGDPARRRSGSDEMLRAVGVGLAAVAAIGVLRSADLGPLDPAVWPVVLVAVGALVLWRTASIGHPGRDAPAPSEVMGRLLGSVGSDGRPWRHAYLRILLGVAVAVFGLVAFVTVNASVGAIGRGLLATGTVVLGVALLFGPWLWRLGTDLSEERRERIRNQERAEMAAHLHDSVLHTLTLIQRHPERSDEVVRLARRQERELRAWLRDPDGELPEGTFAELLRTVADQVEDEHGVAVDAVFVGDAPADEHLRHVVAAASEALRNAARHAGVGEVSLYAEIEDGIVEVFVRDRGCGFDRASVPPDRHGLADSIEARMARLGGNAQVRSRPGQGTEVALRLGHAGEPA